MHWEIGDVVLAATTDGNYVEDVDLVAETEKVGDPAGAVIRCVEPKLPVC